MTATSENYPEDNTPWLEPEPEPGAKPDAGDLIQGTGGLRKLRFADKRRNKGKRGGLRVIYYYWGGGLQFWMFTLYDKDEMSDLTSDERKILARMLDAEIAQRSAR